MSRYNSRTQRWIKKILPASLKKKYQKRIDENTVANWEKQGRSMPPPHAVKVRTVENFQKETGYTTLVETGTFMGDMIVAQLDNFDKIYSIELSEEFWENAKELFKNESKVNLLQGDSGKVMKDIVKDLTAPAVFWLDGHYSGGDTAMGEKECPIYEELRAIFNSEQKNCLLIDDARMFIGENDYPTLAELKAFILENRSNATIKVDADTISVLY